LHFATNPPGAVFHFILPGARREVRQASLAEICTDLPGFTCAGKRRRLIGEGMWSKMTEPANRSMKSALSCLFAIGDGNPVNCLAFIEGILWRPSDPPLSPRRPGHTISSPGREKGRGRGMRTKIG
jgi:hypothetical protein